jgi:hypothetical protein
MSRGLRSVGADADELLRLVWRNGPHLNPTPIVEEYLRQRYRDVFNEGHEQGKLDTLTGNGRKDNPYVR